MSGLGDERLDRGYRAANDTLDERPSAATRASILAAAARQVQAGPRDAQALRRVPRAGAMLRWPMAAAAAVLLSTLAVMMAVRTEREMPSFSPPAEIAEPRATTASDSPSVAASSVHQSAPAGADVSKPTAPSAASSAASDSPAAERKRALAKESGIASPPIAVPPATTPPAAALSSAPTTRDQAAASAQIDAKVMAATEGARAKEEVAAQFSPAMPASPSPAREASRSNESATAPAAPAVSMPQAKADATLPTEAEGRRNERSDGASASLSKLRQAPAPTGALGAGASAPRSEPDAGPEVTLRAEDWLEKIIKLRMGGRHDEADAELKRFRERYPHVQVPASALPATGTR